MNLYICTHFSLSFYFCSVTNALRMWCLEIIQEKGGTGFDKLMRAFSANKMPSLAAYSSTRVLQGERSSGRPAQSCVDVHISLYNLCCSLSWITSSNSLPMHLCNLASPNVCVVLCISRLLIWFDRIITWVKKHGPFHIVEVVPVSGLWMTRPPTACVKPGFATITWTWDKLVIPIG